MKRNAWYIVSAVLLVAFTSALSQNQSTLQTQPVQAGGPPKIEVSEATYGLNCQNSAAGNATQYVKNDCEGKTTCNFPVSHASGKIGDHCPGQVKDFDVSYLCGDKPKNGHVNGESTGQTITLTCAN
jgi:hypothetical protein